MKLTEATTIQQFIKLARGLRDKIVLEHAILFFEGISGELVFRGKCNPHMKVLSSRGLFRFDDQSRGSKTGSDYKPAWRLTDAGRAALEQSKEK